MRAYGRLTRTVRVLALAGVIGGAGAACRDSLDPFRPLDRGDVVDPSLVRLTYSGGDDRMPAWSNAGDSLYYTAARGDDNPFAPTRILALPSDASGPARTLLQNVQADIYRNAWIGTPAPGPDGRIAFVHLPPLLPASPCTGTRVCPLSETLPMVRLIRGVVHVRAIDATHGLTDDVVLPLQFAGHSVESDAAAPGGIITVSDYHPFQYRFEAGGEQFFRASWNPDGTELVVSDGLRLLRWTIGAAAPAPIPGTEDGVLPAWSPDGGWIAYARYARIAAETFDCEYQNVYNPPSGPVTVTDCIERRTLHYTSDPVIVLTRPDGSEDLVLGPGADPAWSPDGESVYASAHDGAHPSIVRISLNTMERSAIPGTAFGIEPAVSPDGRRLAFAKSGQPAGLPHDIWVVELP